ncbi:hypothetical protein DFH27DRAFT_607019 [Peziza echinospora]|nr:hypothetical protein DFH27DRAFT_607019 [Peziza echinospora]
MQPSEVRLVCPHVHLATARDHGFMFIPFQTKAECSQNCIQFVAFMVQELDAFSDPRPASVQAWVRKSLIACAPSFTRTLTAIPVKLIPISSHVMNIDRQVEGRLISVDFVADQAIFKLDRTSQSKLAVFYTELTGKNPSFEFTEKLDAMRIRMGMSEVVGIELLDFEEVFGEVFGLSPTTNEDQDGDREQIIPDANVGEEWSKLRQSLYGLSDTVFCPSYYEAGSDGEASSASTGLTRSTNDVLETFPEDRVSTPCAYWGPMQINSHNAFAYPDQSGFFNGSSPSVIDPSSSSSSNPRFRGSVKTYGNLEYKKPAKICRIPATPALVSLEDPPSPSIFSLPTPVYSQPLLPTSPSPDIKISTGSRLKLPVHAHQWSTNSPECESIIENTSERYLTSDSPSSQSMDYKLNTATKVSNPSNLSNQSIYSAFPATPTIASIDGSSSQFANSNTVPTSSEMWINGGYPLVCQRNPSQRAEKFQIPYSNTIAFETSQAIRSLQGLEDRVVSTLPPDHEGSLAESNIKHNDYGVADEYGFESDDGQGVCDARPERATDAAQIIIQEKVKAMLNAAQSGGIVFKATRDGIDNHPISVRLRSLSGVHKAIDGAWQAEHDAVAAAYTLEKLSKLSKQKGIPSFEEDGHVSPNNEWPGNRPDYRVPRSSPCQSLKYGKIETTHRQLEHGDNSIIQSMASTTSIEELRALRDRFEEEGELILGALSRTIERMHVLDQLIGEKEGTHVMAVKARAREMMEYWGYDESAYILENISNKNAIPTSSVEPQMFDRNSLPTESKNPELVGANEVMGPNYPSAWSVSTDISPCCQLGGGNEKSYTLNSKVMCAHGMLRKIKPLVYPTSSTLSANNIDTWKLNYTIGAKHGKSLKPTVEQQISQENTPVSTRPINIPPELYTGTDVPLAVTGTGPNLRTSYSCVADWAMKQATEKYSPTRKNYYDKLSSYFSQSPIDYQLEQFQNVVSPISTVQPKPWPRIGNEKDKMEGNWEEHLEMGMAGMQETDFMG